MFNNINWHAVVTNTYYCCLQVLQLNNILLIFIYLSFVYFPNLVLITLTKQLPYFNSTNAYYYVTVALRV
jgi:hypothetical protein